MSNTYATFEGTDEKGRAFSIESSTQSAEQMSKNLGQEPSKESKPAPTEPQADGDDGEGDQTHVSAPAANGEPKKHKPAQPRIDKLTREKKEAEERADSIAQRAAKAEAELADFKARMPKEDKPKPAETKVEAKPRPQLADYPTIEDHAEAVAEWVADRRETSKRDADEAAKVEAKHRESEASYEKRVTSFRDSFMARAAEDPTIAQSEVAGWIPFRNLSPEKIQEYQRAEASGNTVPFAQAQIAQQLLERGEKGLDMMVYFKDNPDEARRIAALETPMSILVELAIIEKSLGTGNPTASVSKPESSKAAPPARPVTGGPPIRDLGPSEADDDEVYLRKRNADRLRKLRTSTA